MVCRPSDYGNSVLCTGLLALIAMLGMSDSHAGPTSPADTIRTPDGFDLQGHRGARGLAPENTIPAFRRALELGVTTLEMDVAIAGDGTVVVSHEPWMAPDKCVTAKGEPITHGKDHNIYDMAYEEVAAYDCGSQRLSDFPGQESQSAPKPRLRDVIQMAEAYTEEHGRVSVFYNIEIKSRPEWDGQFHPEPTAFVEQVLAVVTSEQVAPRTTIQSFDPRSLEAAHRQTAPVRTALLVAWGTDEGLAANLEALSFVPDIYSPDARLVSKDLVTTVHERDLHLIPWTVNDPAAMRRLLRLGVDGLITDYPDRGRGVVDEHTAE